MLCIIFFMKAVSAFLKAYHLVFDSLEVGDFHVVTFVKQTCIDSVQCLHEN